MKTVEHVHGLRRSLGDHADECLPHVARHERERLTPRLAEPLEEFLERVLRAIASDPEKPLARVVDLVDEYEVFVALFPGEFVDADGSNAVEVAIRETPLHGHRHRVKDRLPAHAKALRRLLPAERLRPAREEPRERRRHRRLALRPRHALNLDAAARAVASPRRVHEVHRDGPQGHELKVTLGQVIAYATLSEAARTDWSASLMRPEMRLDHRNAAPASFAFTELHLLVNKSGLLLQAIE